jgi:prepilin-type processing-associated H-X9-DG protein
MPKVQITRWLLGAAVVSSLAGLAVRAAEPEDELKAAAVLSFVRYAEWPQGAAEGPITIGVAGRPAMVATLRRTLAGKIVNNRTVTVVHIKAVEPRCCQVLYVATDNNKQVHQLLAGIGNPPPLTIGEAERFLESGGAVNLMFVDGHMSFEVNLDALQRSGIGISSKLLRYGRVKARPSS